MLKLIKKIEAAFGIYRVTKRRYFTSYYIDIERVGRLSGKYQRLHNSRWVSGEFNLNLKGDKK